MKTELMTISPKQAQAWLDGKGNNRRLNPRHITYLANEIKAGRWRLTHQGIAFSDDGCLIDGQHRLAAIVESQIATKMMVTFEMPIGNFAIIDRGMPRNMETIIGIPRIFTQSYMFMLQLAIRNSMRQSPDDVYQLHKHFGHIALSLQNATNSSIRYFSAAPVRSAAIVTMAGAEDQSNKYVLNTYHDLVLQNLRPLPPIALALIKAYNRAPKNNSNSGFTMRTETYMKARYIFDLSNAGFDKIEIRDNIRDRYFHEITDLVQRALGSLPGEAEAQQLKRQLDLKNAQLRQVQDKLMKKTAQDLIAEQDRLSMEAKD